MLIAAGATLQGPSILNTDEPMFNALVSELLDKKPRVFTVLLLLFKVPLLSINCPSAEKTSCKVHTPPIPLKKTSARNDLPPIVMVWPAVVASRYTSPKKFSFIPETNVTEPYIFKIFDAGPASVGVFIAPVQVMFLQYAVSTFIVTLWPANEKELASKNTLSTGDGEQPEGAPPLVSDQ